tara:strand:+ start:15527 stop:15862 length:336 start_codon:yes stop_codon:yes gene_type:complete
MNSLVELDKDEQSPWIYGAIAGGVALVGGTSIALYHKISKRNIIKRDESANKEINRQEVDKINILSTPRDDQVNQECESHVSSGVEIDLGHFLDIAPLSTKSDSESDFSEN